MDIRKIRKLIELINETGIGEIEIKSGEESVRINRSAIATTTPIISPTPPPPTFQTTSPTTKPHHDEPPPPPEPEGEFIKSPMVGTAYLSPTPSADPFIKVGQKIKAGDTLCLIEAMKMFNQIQAEKEGTLKKVFIENEQAVEFGQKLFIID